MGSRLVIINNIKRSFHHKLLWIIVFLAPIVLSYMVNMFEQLSQTTYRVGILSNGENKSERDASMLITQLNQMDGITAKEAEEESFQTDIIMGVYHYGINLDLLGSNLNLDDMDQETLEKALVSYSNPEGITQFAKYLKNQPEKSSHDSLSQMERTIGFLASLFMVISVLHAGMYICDKQEGLLVRYCYSPKHKRSYLIGNYMYIYLITFLQVGISFFILTLLQKNKVAIVPFILIVGTLSLITSLFAILISCISKSETNASITASSVTAIFTLLSGTFMSFSQLPALLQYVGVVNPIRWCLELYHMIG